MKECVFDYMGEFLRVSVKTWADVSNVERKAKDKYGAKCVLAWVENKEWSEKERMTLYPKFKGVRS